MSTGKFARRGICLLIAVLMIMGMAGPSWADLFAFVTTEPATEFSNGELLSEQADLTVRIAYSAEAQVPEGAFIMADEIPEGCAEYEAYLAAASKIVLEGHPDRTITSARFCDLHIADADGQKIEPKADVEVYLGMDGLDSENDFILVHFPKNADVSGLLDFEPSGGEKRAAGIMASDTFVLDDDQLTAGVRGLTRDSGVTVNGTKPEDGIIAADRETKKSSEAWKRMIRQRTGPRRRSFPRNRFTAAWCSRQTASPCSA